MGDSEELLVAVGIALLVMDVLQVCMAGHADTLKYADRDDTRNPNRRDTCHVIMILSLILLSLSMTLASWCASDLVKVSVAPQVVLKWVTR